jgi:hypothetical protein
MQFNLSVEQGFADILIRRLFLQIFLLVIILPPVLNMGMFYTNGSFQAIGLCNSPIIGNKKEQQLR